MTKKSQAAVLPLTAEGNFKKLTQLHRSRLYRVCLSKGLFVGQPALLLAIRELGNCSQTRTCCSTRRYNTICSGICQET